MNKTLSIAFLFFIPFLINAQSFKQKIGWSGFAPFDKTQNHNFFRIKKDTTISLTHKKHSPKKATIFSAVLPGLGQAYNRKYWKIPLFYAGLGGAGYFMLHNREEMRGRQNALIALEDGNPATQPEPKYARTSKEQLKADRAYYRANRDYGIIALALIYVVNIVDATVDAHFYNFNIDKPLAMQKARHWNITSSAVQNKPTVGLAFTF